MMKPRVNRSRTTRLVVEITMKPEPLTKEERQRADQLASSMQWKDSTDDIVDLILNAEQYWRETVKNSSETTHEGKHDWDTLCFYCGGNGDCPPPVTHEPDCPWLKAQEVEVDNKFGVFLP